jgi:hypothetical protein
MLRSDCDVGLATQAKPAKRCPDQGLFLQDESRAWEPSPNGSIPPALKAGETGNRNLPESFDALASDLNNKFARLAADIEKMRKELRDAEERSEQLKHQLLDGKLLASL